MPTIVTKLPPRALPYASQRRKMMNRHEIIRDNLFTQTFILSIQCVCYRSEHSLRYNGRLFAKFNFDIFDRRLILRNFFRERSKCKVKSDCEVDASPSPQSPIPSRINGQGISISPRNGTVESLARWSKQAAETAPLLSHPAANPWSISVSGERADTGVG